jgi:hypothetical protein
MRVLFYLVPFLGCHVGCLKAQPPHSIGSSPVSSAVTEEVLTPRPENTPIPLSPQGFFTTIAEVVKRPGFFDGQKVRLSGKVTNLRPVSSRHGKSISHFDLVDNDGNKVRVNLEKPSTLKARQQVSVEGQLAMSPDPAAHTVVVLTNSRLISKIDRPTPAKQKIVSPREKSQPAPSQLFPSPPVESPEQAEGQVF